MIFTTYSNNIYIKKKRKRNVNDKFNGSNNLQMQ